MNIIQIFHTVHHGLEIIFSLLILFATYYAVKRFRLAIWRKGWYVLALGSFIIALVEFWGLFESLGLVEETNPAVILVHTIHTFAFLFIALGIILLARSAGRIWGGKKTKN